MFTFNFLCEKSQAEKVFVFYFGINAIGKNDLDK